MKEALLVIAFLCEPSYSVRMANSCKQKQAILQRKVKNCKSYLTKCTLKAYATSKFKTHGTALNACISRLRK